MFTVASAALGTLVAIAIMVFVLAYRKACTDGQPLKRLLISVGCIKVELELYDAPPRQSLIGDASGARTPALDN